MKDRLPLFANEGMKQFLKNRSKEMKQEESRMINELQRELEYEKDKLVDKITEMLLNNPDLLN